MSCRMVFLLRAWYILNSVVETSAAMELLSTSVASCYEQEQFCQGA